MAYVVFPRWVTTTIRVRARGPFSHAYIIYTCVYIYIYVILCAKEVFELFLSPSDVHDLIAAPTSFHLCVHYSLRRKYKFSITCINHIFIMLSSPRTISTTIDMSPVLKIQFRIYTCVRTVA